MMKRIFITGGSGFLGTSLVEKLSVDYDLILLEHKKKNKRIHKKRITTVAGSITDASKWKQNLVSVDVIVHLAGITHSNDPGLYKDVNTHGTIELAKAAAEYKVKQFVYISTRAIGPGCGPYGESKRAAENFLKKSGIKYTILRVGEVYDEGFAGKEGLGNVFRLIKKSIIVPVPGNVSIILAPVKKSDVINCILASVNNINAYFKTYTIAGPEEISIKEVFKRIAVHFGWKRVFIPIPTIIIKMMFGFSRGFVGVSASDQLVRLLCKKEGLSKNVYKDLKVIPEKFLAYSE